MKKLYKFKADVEGINVNISSHKIINSEYIGFKEDIEVFTPNFDKEGVGYTVEELTEPTKPLEEVIQPKAELTVKGAMSTGELVAKAKAVVAKTQE